MKRVAGYVAISVLAALSITGATYFVTEDAFALVPGSHAAYSGATSRGFPTPYSMTFCCGIANGVNLLPSRTFYYEQNMLTDLFFWLAVSLACAAGFSRRRLLVGAAAGVAFTLITLLLHPLSSVAPGYGAETEVLSPMGFPYEYLTYYKTGLGAVTFSGYEFNLSAVLADYVLWAAVALAIVGMTGILMQRRYFGIRLGG
jgi:hypothetical protein